MMTSLLRRPTCAAALPGSTLLTSAPPESGASTSVAPSKALWMLSGGPDLRGVAVRVGDDGGQVQRLAFAQQADLDLVADAHQPDGIAQLAVGFHGLAVDGGDDVAGVDAGLLGG